MSLPIANGSAIGECDLIQFRKKFGKANVTSLVERVSRFAIFLRNNDRQSRPGPLESRDRHACLISQNHALFGH